MGSPSVSHSITLRLRFRNRIGMLGRVTSTIGETGGDIGAVDIVSADRDQMIRDITVNARDEAHAHLIVQKIRSLPGISVVHVSDRTFLLHLGGKIEIANKIPIKTRDDLSMVYTPGVARVSMAIHDDPNKAFQLTIKRNAVAIVTDGSAVLGLGNIGPEAALPVMEGKSMLFKEFGGIDAFPLCLATQKVDEIVETVIRISPGFGGIHLEDISAPRCFEIEEKLKKALQIPVFHDDQHGTAVVVLAAALNAVKIVRKRLSDLRVVVNGIGAAGVACSKILMQAGVRNIIGCDKEGILHPGRRSHMNGIKRWYARHTNPRRIKGGISEAMDGADIFIGVSGPNVLTVEHLRRMAKNPIVFALANPTPEIMPEEAAAYVRVMATGRSDYPNQINNVLSFPGIFRGALDVRAREINDQMKLAAAHAIAAIVQKDELSEDYIIPGVFDRRVGKRVAQEVARAAHQTGVARREVKGGF
jgi:malate dehydrogenase (oxaloacetate-decarboxylating)